MSNLEVFVFFFIYFESIILNNFFSYWINERWLCKCNCMIIWKGGELFLDSLSLEDMFDKFININKNNNKEKEFLNNVYCVYEFIFL